MISFKEMISANGIIGEVKILILLPLAKYKAKVKTVGIKIENIMRIDTTKSGKKTQARLMLKIKPRVKNTLLLLSINPKNLCLKYRKPKTWY